MAAHGGGIDLSQIRNQQAQQQQAEMGIRLAMANCAASIAVLPLMVVPMTVPRLRWIWVLPPVRQY